MQIKNLKAELDYHHEDLTKVKAQTKIFTNPFAVYNKEIVLENGSSLFGKIIYQDQDVMKVETLIGQLIINRNTIVRVVNQIGSYNKFGDDYAKAAMEDMVDSSETSGSFTKYFNALFRKYFATICKIVNCANRAVCKRKIN